MVNFLDHIHLIYEDKILSVFRMDGMSKDRGKQPHRRVWSCSHMPDRNLSDNTGAVPGEGRTTKARVDTYARWEYFNAAYKLQSKQNVPAAYYVQDF
jgi:hypothetical protein